MYVSGVGRPVGLVGIVAIFFLAGQTWVRAPATAASCQKSSFPLATIAFASGKREACVHGAGKEVAGALFAIRVYQSAPQEDRRGVLRERNPLRNHISDVLPRCPA